MKPHPPPQPFRLVYLEKNCCFLIFSPQTSEAHPSTHYPWGRSRAGAQYSYRRAKATPPCDGPQDVIPCGQRNVVLIVVFWHMTKCTALIRLMPSLLNRAIVELLKQNTKKRVYAAFAVLLHVRATFGRQCTFWSINSQTTRVTSAVSLSHPPELTPASHPLSPQAVPPWHTNTFDLFATNNPPSSLGASLS